MPSTRVQEDILIMILQDSFKILNRINSGEFTDHLFHLTFQKTLSISIMCTFHSLFSSMSQSSNSTERKKYLHFCMTCIEKKTSRKFKKDMCRIVKNVMFHEEENVPFRTKHSDVKVGFIMRYPLNVAHVKDKKIGCEVTFHIMTITYSIFSFNPNIK